MSSHVYQPFNAESLAVAKIDLYPLPCVGQNMGGWLIFHGAFSGAFGPGWCGKSPRVSRHGTVRVWACRISILSLCSRYVKMQGFLRVDTLEKSRKATRSLNSSTSERDQRWHLAVVDFVCVWKRSSFKSHLPSGKLWIPLRQQSCSFINLHSPVPPAQVVAANGCVWKLGYPPQWWLFNREHHDKLWDFWVPYFQTNPNQLKLMC